MCMNCNDMQTVQCLIVHVNVYECNDMQTVQCLIVHVNVYEL